MNIIVSEFKEAKKKAKKLSTERWNSYFHISVFNYKYLISDYWVENASCYYLKGEHHKHIQR